MRLAVQAPGKVNLCLFLGPLRADSRHELVTLIESVSLADQLTITTSTEDRVHCPGLPEPNIVSLTLQKLRANGWDGPPLHVHIEKIVPVAGGMGGGSADAAALLRAADSLAPLPGQTQRKLAAELGADVPSQLEPGLALATGAGERVQPVSSLEPHAFVIVPQPYPLSTKDVYAEADRLGLPRTQDELKTLHQQLLETTKRPRLANDLEPAARSLRPELGDVLDAVTADEVLVSGSGPTVFGLFWGHDAAEKAEARALRLRARFPGASVALPVGADAGRPRELA